MVSFYSYLVPLATSLIILMLLVQYWVDKYNLFRRFNASVVFSYQMTLFMFKIFHLTIPISAIGKLLFLPYTSMSDASILLNILLVILACAYTLFIWLMPSWLEK